MNVVQRLAKGSLGEHNLAEHLMKLSKDHKVSSEPGESEDLWGPKTSEPADLNTYSSKDLKSIIDITADTPEDVCHCMIKLVRKHIKAFGFDDQLGTLGAKASI